MFSKGRERESSNVETTSVNRIDTIIGESAVIEGVIRTTGTTRVDGKIIGEARSQGILIIGENGYIEGDVNAEAMLIAGKVKGQVKVKDRLELAESGRVLGDIHTKTLVISEGASFEGKCVMTEEKKAATPEAANTNNKDKEVKDGQKRVGTN